MRVSEAALALITRVNAQGETEYLTQWNEKWQAYSLIGGHREAGESFRECCIREVEEELGLKRDVDFTVADDPVTPTCEYTAYSHSALEKTRYRVSVFPAQVAPGVMHMIDATHGNRWLNASEIIDRQTSTGRTVSDQIAFTLQLTGN